VDGSLIGALGVGFLLGLRHALELQVVVGGSTIVTGLLLVGGAAGP